MPFLGNNDGRIHGECEIGVEAVCWIANDEGHVGQGGGGQQSNRNRTGGADEHDRVAEAGLDALRHRDGKG